jgi:hypothetical protein
MPRSLAKPSKLQVIKDTLLVMGALLVPIALIALLFFALFEAYRAFVHPLI